MARGMFLAGFSVWRPQREANGKGGFATTYSDTGQSVNGRLSPLSAAQVIMASQEVGHISHIFSCSPGTDIRIGDQVRGGAETVIVDAVRTTSQTGRRECMCVLEQRA